MSIAAFILCRKNSKRLPDKNTKELCGKPLICWTIDSAIESGVIDTLIVGTDDERIKEICDNYVYYDDINSKLKIQIIDLPNYLTVDNAPQTEALLYCMDQIEKHDYICLLQVTSPLRDIKDFEFLEFIGAIDGLLPPMDRIGQYNNYLSIQSKSNNSKYKDKCNGAFYVTWWDMFYRNREFPLPCYDLEMPEERSIDIDTEFDFKIAEMLMKERLNKIPDSVKSK